MSPPWYFWLYASALLFALLPGPAIVNGIVAFYFGRPPAVSSCMLTYFLALYGAARAFALPASPSGPFIEPGLWEGISMLAGAWIEGLIHYWYLHLPYFLFGVAGAWVGLVLRKRRVARAAN